MKTLRFVVKDKRITRQDCFTVVDGVVNQYEFQLRFDSDWDGLTKTVVWENGDVKVELLYTGGLILPWEVCKEGALLLSVNGSKTLGDGRTQIVRTARMTRPIQVVPHGSESGEKPGEFTPELAEQCRRADILISAVGRRGLITSDMVKPGAVVVDVAMNRNEEGKLCGDVDFAAVAEKAAYITPVPGGVGPMTRAMLMENTVSASRRRQRKED